MLTKNNRQDMFSYQRQKLEAERDVAQAKGNAGFSADLFASYGLSQSADGRRLSAVQR